MYHFEYVKQGKVLIDVYPTNEGNNIATIVVDDTDLSYQFSDSYMHPLSIKSIALLLFDAFNIDKYKLSYDNALATAVAIKEYLK